MRSLFSSCRPVYKMSGEYYSLFGGDGYPTIDLSFLDDDSDSDIPENQGDLLMVAPSNTPQTPTDSEKDSPASAGYFSGEDVIPSISTHQPVGILSPPVPAIPMRNYKLAAEYPQMPTIIMGDNGFKYWGIASQKFSNTVYLTDRGQHDVMIMDSTTGQLIHRFGQCGFPHMANLFRPCGIACDELNRRLIICDKDNHRIVFCSMTGEFISSFGMKGHKLGEFNYPWDVAVSPFGNHIAVADSRNHRIQIFDRYGNFLKRFSVFEFEPFEYKEKFDYPRGITFDNSGKNVYATDFNTNNVLGLNLESWESRLLVPSGKMCRPQGITMDEAGNLLVCDSRKQCIRVMSTNGDLLQTVDFGIHPLESPGDLTMMQWGKVAVVDLSGYIRMF